MLSGPLLATVVVALLVVVVITSKAVVSVATVGMLVMWSCFMLVVAVVGSALVEVLDRMVPLAPSLTIPSEAFRM